MAPPAGARPDWDRVEAAMRATGLERDEVRAVILAGYPEGRRAFRRTNWHRVAAAMEAVERVSPFGAAIVLAIHRTRAEHAPADSDAERRIAHRYLFGSRGRPAAEPSFEAAFCWCVPENWARRIGVEARPEDRTDGYDRASRNPKGSLWVPPRADRIRLLRWAGEGMPR